MRAGPYAEVDGVVHPCVALTGPSIRLLAFGSAPTPDWEPEPWDRWSRLVDRSAVTRLFWVRTSAVWSGYPVEVERVEGDRATFRNSGGTDLPTDNPAVERIGMFEWQGTVPTSELSDVVEVVEEYPL